MSSAVCRVNRLHHDWDNGLACRWCGETRTAAEAIVSGLASRRGGDEKSARLLLATFRAQVLTEAAALIEDAACDADFTEDPPFVSGLRAAVELLTEAATKGVAG